MPTTLTNGIQLPDKGSVDWYSSMESNYNLIDTHLGDTDVHVTAEDKANWNSKQGSLSQDQLDAIAQVATNTSDIATLQSDKADASHTHSSSDITDIDDYATKQYVDNSISGLVDNAPDALNTLNELSAALNDDSNFAGTVTTALAAKANSADLATVATSGSYNDLDDLPTIPTNTSDLTNDSDFVISSNLATVATSGDYDDLSNKPSIPTNTSDLNNDSNFVDTSNSAVASGITSAKVTDYDTHIADTNIHVTTADKNRWNNQTYVFRYSSTALTPSSTNSNTLLDNTDNLKVGDKVIDSSGVLFSITAIDIKTISNIVQDTSAYNGSVSWVIRDKDNLNNILEYSLYKYSAKSIDWQLKLTGIDNGVSNTKGIRFTLDPVNNVANFIPIGNNTTSLGNSSTRWKDIYATNYYYGNDNVEFSTKFVTTDTAQTIVGNKTFASNVNVYNSDNTATTPNFTLRSSKSAIGTSDTDVQTIFFSDKNGTSLASVKAQNFTSNGATYLLNSVNTKDTNDQIIEASTSLYILNNGRKVFRPNTDNEIFLGYSLQKWKDFYTYLINGLEPSSLSLPDIANKIDISSYITDLTGAPNQYISPSNGYINLRSTNADILGIVENTSGMGTISRGNNQTIAVYLPVVANSSISLYVKCISLAQAYFIPCQGNV